MYKLHTQQRAKPSRLLHLSHMHHGSHSNCFSPSLSKPTYSCWCHFRQRSLSLEVSLACTSLCESTLMPWYDIVGNTLLTLMTQQVCIQMYLEEMQSTRHSMQLCSKISNKTPPKGNISMTQIIYQIVQQSKWKLLWHRHTVCAIRTSGKINFWTLSR